MDTSIYKELNIFKSLIVFEFKVGDEMTFAFIGEDDEMTTLNESHICIIRKLDGRYAVIDFSEKPVVQNEPNLAHINRTITVKLNGYAKCSIMGPNGVTPSNFPLADIVNINGSVVFKTVIRQ